MRSPFLTIALVAASALLTRRAPPAYPAGDADAEALLAARFIEAAGAEPGLCVILGAGDAVLARELAHTAGFLVHVIDPDPARVESARHALADDSSYGRQLVVEQLPWGQLPHADRTVDLILATALSAPDLERLTPAEILRALRPRGTAILGARPGGASPPLASEQLVRWWAAAGLPDAPARPIAPAPGAWLQITRPPEPGTDEWTHWEHMPDNNPVSTDTVIRAPYLTQWLGNPLYIAMPAITTAAGGRLFLAMGHIAHHEREEPWLNTLLACNGYNGIELWRRKLPDGYLVHRSAFIATRDTFYMINPDGAGCLLLDPASGQERDRIRVPELPGEWKWIALEDGTLHALVGKEKDPPETTIVRSEYTHWSWGELSRGYYQKRIPWGFGETLLAYDLERRAARWSHREPGAIDSRSLVMGGGRLFFYAPDSRVGCLDAASGALLWANDDPAIRALIDEPGRNLTSTPGFRTSCYSLYTPQALLFQAQTQMNVVALSPEDGRLLWSKQKITSNPNMLYLDGHVLVGIGPDGDTLVVEPRTGEVLQDLGFKKRSCARLTATPDSIFCRGWPEGLTRYDRQTGRILFNGALRPACNDGVIGAHGLLYTGPWLCDCNLSLMGRVTMCSAADLPLDPAGAAHERFSAGTGGLLPDAPLDLRPEDWPTYRGGNARRGASVRSVPTELERIWTFLPERPFQPTAPVAAGDLIYVAGDDGALRAIDGTTGQTRWLYRTAGPILQPTSIWNGRAYIGSGDGHLYALDAGTGRLLWRFRAAPRERRIMVYGALCSTWPVNSGVLVEEGIAYAAAGIVDTDGTYVYALDAVTGEVRWENARSGHLRPDLRKGVSAQGILTTARGRLWMPGGNVVSPAAYDLSTGAYVGEMPEDGSPRANRGEEIGLLADDCILYGGRLRYSATENVVNPGSFVAVPIQPDGRGGAQIQIALGKIPPAWNDRCMLLVQGRRTPPQLYGRDAVSRYLAAADSQTFPPPQWQTGAIPDADVVALILAENCAVVAHETPGFRSRDPRWAVSGLDLERGSLLWQHLLPGPAVAGGLLVDRHGQVVVVLADGSAVAYGGPGSWERRLERARAWARQAPANRPQAARMLQADLLAVHQPRVREMVIAELAALGVRVGESARRAGYVTDWHLLGPVPWDAQAHGLDAPLIGEPEVDITAPAMVSGTALNWRAYMTSSPQGTVDLAAIYGPHEAKALYAHAEVALPRDERLLLKVGSNDGFKCWFNGIEAGRFDGGRLYLPDQDTLEVRGRAGINRILLKITQQGGAWAFGVRIARPDGAPLDLEVGGQSAAD